MNLTIAEVGDELHETTIYGADAKGTESKDSRETAQKAVQYLLADVDANEADNRQRAWSRHISRAFGEALGCLGAVVLVVGVTGTSSTLASDGLTKCLRGAATCQSASSLWPLAVWAVFLSLIVGGLVYLFYYHWRQKERWELATSEASRREPEKCARGYLSIFLIYTRTKHYAFFTRLFGLSAILSSLFVGTVIVVGGSEDSLLLFGWTVPSWLLLLGLPSLAIILSAAILYKGFELGRDFVPGRALVKNTIILAFLATTSQTDYTAASNAAQIVLEKIRNERPWSFYSFRTARSGAER